MKTHDCLAGVRVSRPQTGPLTDGGCRIVGRLWGVDFDAGGNATRIVMWPEGLSQAAYLRGAKAAIKRMRPSRSTHV